MASIQYQISNQIFGHEAAVRDIACTENGMIITGGMDSIVHCWSKLEQSMNVEYCQTISVRDHQHWVTAVLYLPPKKLAACPNGGFVTGSMDKLIRVYSIEGNLIRTIAGHSGGVISLAWGCHDELISGSWDETARLWNLHDGSCISVLSGHENGVCVIGLPNGMVATGSTGKQEGNTVVGFQVRMWKEGKVINSFKDHTGPVRRFALVPGTGFISASNDGSIILRDLSGNPLVAMNHPLNNEGKPAFILGVACLSTGEYVSAGEDCTARVWSADGNLIQTISHPSGLWCVEALPDGDFATGGDDQVVRIFTRNSTIVSQETINAFEKAVAEANAARRQGPSDVDIAKLPAFENRGNVKGRSEGDIQMFRKGNAAWACQWSAISGTWIEIGQVTGTGSGGTVDGIAYDIVIPVEIENPATSAIQKLEIGYNQGENAFSVAQQFIDKHNLNQNYLQQIADYIIQRSGSYQAPVLGVPNQESSTVPSAATASYSYFPQKNYLAFDAIKIDKLFSTVTEFNSKIGANQDMQSNHLTDEELQHINDIITVIQQTAYYHSSTIKPEGIRALCKMLNWPNAYVFPAMDLARLVILHPHGATALGSGDLGRKILLSAMEKGADNDSSTPNSVRMLALRIATNMFLHECSRNTILSCHHEVMELLPRFVPYDNKINRLSLATLLLNFSVAIKGSTFPVPQETREKCINIVSTFLQGKDIANDAIIRALVAIGTIVMGDQDAKEKVLGCGIHQCIDLLMNSNDENVKQCAAEFTDIVNRR